MVMLRAHLRYLWYVTRHKWFVFLECWRLGVPLWQSLPHDWDKFLPDEWFPYVAKFYGPTPTTRETTGGYDPSPSALAFKIAWLKHWHRNAHHWEHWVQSTRKGPEALPMPDCYRREMLADWRGAGRAQGKGNDVAAFYQANGPTMVLHPDTRAWIEAELDISLTLARAMDAVEHGR